MKRYLFIVAAILVSLSAKADGWNFYVQREPNAKWDPNGSVKQIEPWPASMAKRCAIQLGWADHAVKVVNKDTGEERTVLCDVAWKAHGKVVKSKPAAPNGKESTVKLW
jgi:hypothetical protein